MGDEAGIQGFESAESREAFWRGLFDIHPDPLAYLDADYRIVRANQVLAEALGCRAEDLVGRHCYEVFHNSSCPIQSCPHSQLLSDGCAHAEELYIVTLSGIYWVSVTPVFDAKGRLVGSLHIARNVSRYKAIEVELRVARDVMAVRVETRTRELQKHIRFEQLLVSLALDFGQVKSDLELKRLIQHGVVEIATTGGYDRCVFWMIEGKTAEAVARYERAGTTLGALPDKVTDEDAAWLFSASDRMCLIDQFADGHKRCVTVLLSQQEGGGGVALQVEYGPNEQKGDLPMTPDRLRLFCQLFFSTLWRHANMVEIQRMRDEMTHLDRVSRLGQLTAMLAHELNQPLAATLCNAQAAVRWLEQTPPDVAEARSALDDIAENVRRAGAVVQRTRAMFKGSHLPMHRVDMYTLVENVVTLLNGTIALTGTVVERSVGASLPPVWGDEVQLQQVLLNLLGNAIDAVCEKPKNARNIAVSAEVDRVAGMLLLSVKDSGVGFPPGHEELVFKPFHTTKPDGMGMGLSICRQIVEGLGGKIRAEREAGWNTVFRVVLPLAAGE